jgi:hypothetical protein
VSDPSPAQVFTALPGSLYFAGLKYVLSVPVGRGLLFLEPRKTSVQMPGWTQHACSNLESMW